METLSPQAAATRATILAAARAAFADQGLHATTRAIAARAGVTQPLIHHYFGSKDALFDAVLEDAVADYERAQQAQWERSMDDLRFFTEGLAVLFRWLGEQRDLMRLSAWARLEGRRSLYNSAVPIFERVRARLQHAHEGGILRPDVDIDATMIMLEVIFKGYWDRREVIEQYPISCEDLDGRYLNQTIRTLLCGLMTPEAATQALERLGC